MVSRRLRYVLIADVPEKTEIFSARRCDVAKVPCSFLTILRAIHIVVDHQNRERERVCVSFFLIGST
jgi:hypothetical protein